MAVTYAMKLRVQQPVSPSSRRRRPDRLPAAGGHKESCAGVGEPSCSRRRLACPNRGGPVSVSIRDGSWRRNRRSRRRGLGRADPAAGRRPEPGLAVRRCDLALHTGGAARKHGGPERRVRRKIRLDRRANAGGPCGRGIGAPDRRRAGATGPARPDLDRSGVGGGEPANASRARTLETATMRPWTGARESSSCHGRPANVAKAVTAGAVTRRNVRRASEYPGRAIWHPRGGCHRRSRETKMQCFEQPRQRPVARDADRPFAAPPVRIAGPSGHTARGIRAPETPRSARGRGGSRPASDLRTAVEGRADPCKRSTGSWSIRPSRFPVGRRRDSRLRVCEKTRPRNRAAHHPVGVPDQDRRVGLSGSGYR